MPLKFESANRFQLLEVSEPTFTRTGFLDLPRELRDIIYTLILVPSRPIELAPLQCRPRDCPRGRGNFSGASGTAESAKHQWHGWNGHLWHIERYKTIIQPSLQLLRVSKQTHTEAAATFYGQEFRLSDCQGWHLLYVWLRRIGPENQRLLRKITVSHPGATAVFDAAVLWPTDGCRFHVWYRENPLDLSPIPTPRYLSTLQSWEANPRKWKRRAKSWRKRTDPTKILLALSELRDLRVVFHSRNDAITSRSNLNYSNVTGHSIHSVDWSSSQKLKISLWNLVSLYGGREVETKYSAIHGKDYNSQLASMSYVAQDLEYIAQAKKLFDAAEGSGWDVQDVVYDNQYTYPAAENVQCADKDICEFVERYAEEHFGPLEAENVSAACKRWAA